MAGRKQIRAATHLDVGTRLRRARAALGFATLRAFADAASIPANRYSEFESGVRLITVPHALVLKSRFGITLDFIFDGDEGRLPAGIRRGLAA